MPRPLAEGCRGAHERAWCAQNWPRAHGTVPASGEAHAIGTVPASWAAGSGIPESETESELAWAEATIDNSFYVSLPKDSIMTIIDGTISKAQLSEMAEDFYGDMIKGVVDVDKGLLALHKGQNQRYCRKPYKMTNLPAIPDKKRWAEMPFVMQMANIGSEVGRTFKWKAKGNPEMAQKAFIRALDLFDLTIATGRSSADQVNGRASMLRELLRARDGFCEEYLSEDGSRLCASERYFQPFAKAVALRSGR